MTKCKCNTREKGRRRGHCGGVERRAEEKEQSDLNGEITGEEERNVWTDDGGAGRRGRRSSRKESGEENKVGG